MLEIIENTLYLDGEPIEALPLLPDDSTVRVWAVPVEYRPSGYYVDVWQDGGMPSEPACSQRDATYIGDVRYQHDPATRLIRDVERARTDAYQRINEGYERQAQVLAAGYPASERESWSVQIAEAAIVRAGGAEPAPWIDAAAPARGITREQLADLIHAQDQAYRHYHGVLTGTRQALRDVIAAVPVDGAALETLAGIHWPDEVAL